MTIARDFILTTAVFALWAAAAGAQTTAPASDNSKANASSVNSTNKTSTADGQANDSGDISITQQIRKSVMADKSLSSYAHNIKIVTVDGAVTLNGVVRDSHEKSVIAMKAEAIAGNGKVTDDLTVAPSK